MTVTSEDTKKVYTGDGSTTTFAYNFQIAAQADVYVAIADENDVITELTLGTDYTITGIGTLTGGVVTYPVSGSALPNKEKLVIARNMDYGQSVSIENQGGFFALTHETALDKLAMLLQQLKEKFSRIVKFDDYEGDTAPTDLLDSYLDSATDSANATTTSASNASTSETNTNAYAVTTGQLLTDSAYYIAEYNLEYLSAITANKVVKISGGAVTPITSWDDDWFGITSESKSLGETGLIKVPYQLLTTMTGLTRGENLYIQKDLTISTLPSPYPIGKCISTTSIIITRNP
jgi:hypothetical protein